MADSPSQDKPVDNSDTTNPPQQTTDTSAQQPNPLPTPPPPAAPTQPTDIGGQLISEIQAIPEKITEALKAFNPPAPTPPPTEDTTETKVESEPGKGGESNGGKRTFAERWFG